MTRTLETSWMALALACAIVTFVLANGGTSYSYTVEPSKNYQLVLSFVTDPLAFLFAIAALLIVGWRLERFVKAWRR